MEEPTVVQSLGHPMPTLIRALLLGAKDPGSENSREWKFQGANWPASFWNVRSNSELAPERKVNNL